MASDQIPKSRGQIVEQKLYSHIIELIHSCDEKKF